MTTQLSVFADPEAEAAGAVSAVVASLPLSFGPAAATPDVIAVSGHAGWTERASEAIRNGARGVVVSTPVAEDVSALAGTADDAGTPVVLDQPWAGNAALAEADSHTVLADALADAVLFDSVAIAAPGTDPLHLLTEQLSILLQCDIEPQDLRTVQRNANGYTLAGMLPGGAPVALQGILSSALPATASITILTSAGRADVVLPDPAAAWPAEVRTVTATGATTLPTLFESSHRTSWSRAHAHIVTGTTANDLARFAAVTALLDQLNR